MTIQSISNTVSATAPITTSYVAVSLNDIQSASFVHLGINIVKRDGTNVTFLGATADEGDFLQMKLELNSGAGKSFARVINTAPNKAQYVPQSNVKDLAVTTADATGYQATVTLLNGATVLTELYANTDRITQFN